MDRVFLEKSYFLGPDKGGDRAYRLLEELGTEPKVLYLKEGEWNAQSQS